MPDLLHFYEGVRRRELRNLENDQREVLSELNQEELLELVIARDVFLVQSYWEMGDALTYSSHGSAGCTVALRQRRGIRDFFKGYISFE